METQDINNLMEVVVAQRLEQADKNTPYYLLDITKRAGHEIFAYQVAYVVDQLFSFDGITAFGFDFEHEYNDEGGTYLSVTGHLTYTFPDEGEETAIIYSHDDADINADLIEQWDEDEQSRFEYVVGLVSNLIESIDESELNQAYSFYETTFKKGTPFEAYRKKFPETMSIIEKYFIEQNIDVSQKDHRGIYKM